MTKKARCAVGAVYLVAVLASTRAVLAAEPPPVVVGEVGTRVLGGTGDLPKTLRRVLEREIASLALRQASRSRRFVLSASLVKLEHQATTDSESVSCTVSVVLREQKSGAIRAIIEGRARATLQGNEGEAVALEAAARAAIASLPDAVR